MPQPSYRPPDLRALSQLAEDARLGLDAFDAAGDGIAAAMRSSTLDPDGACTLLRLLTEAMRAKLDALVSGLADARSANDSMAVASRTYPVLRTVSETTSAPSRNLTR